ncbi:MAG: hypothetical protein GC185_01570 [Alphaproteobacteria bacterium]|nr:hypothetical protein [Alphaproteobacteria bacterium]
MIPELGHFALALACVIAAVQAVVPLLGAMTGRTGWMRLGRRSAVTLGGLLSISFFARLLAFALSDFTLQGVFRHSHTMDPSLYKMTASWSDGPGLLLLAAWLFALWGFAAARFGGRFPARFLSRALSAQGAILFALLLFILFAANPFARLDAPVVDGLGLSPALQSIPAGFAPALLLAGGAGFALLFCFALAELGKHDGAAVFAARLRVFALIGFAAMTAGVTLGGETAEWSWDPRRNAMLFFWLAGGAILQALYLPDAKIAARGTAAWLKDALKRNRLSLAGAAACAAGILFSSLPHKETAAAFFFVAVFVFLGALHRLLEKTGGLRRWRNLPQGFTGGVLLWLGLAVFLAGATGATCWRSEKTLWMRPSQHAVFAGRDVLFTDVTAGIGVNHDYDRGMFAVFRLDAPDAHVFALPEARWYPVRQERRYVTAARRDGIDVFAVTMGARDMRDHAKRRLRLSLRPLGALGPLGGWLMVLACLLMLPLRRASGKNGEVAE